MYLARLAQTLADQAPTPVTQASDHIGYVTPPVTYADHLRLLHGYGQHPLGGQRRDNTVLSRALENFGGIRNRRHGMRLGQFRSADCVQVIRRTASA